MLHHKKGEDWWKLSYPKYRWVIGYLRGFRFLHLLGCLFNAEIFDVATTKDNVFVDVLQIGRNLFLWTTTLCSVGGHIFEGYRRVFRRYFVERTNVAGYVSFEIQYGAFITYRMSLFEINEIRELLGIGVSMASHSKVKLSLPYEFCHLCPDASSAILLTREEGLKRGYEGSEVVSRRMLSVD